MSTAKAYAKTQVALEGSGSCSSADGTNWDCGVDKDQTTVTLVSTDSFDMSLELGGYLSANIDTYSCTSAVNLDLYSVSVVIAMYGDSTEDGYTFTPGTPADSGGELSAEFVTVGAELSNRDAVTCCPSKWKFDLNPNFDGEVFSDGIISQRLMYDYTSGYGC